MFSTQSKKIISFVDRSLVRAYVAVMTANKRIVDKFDDFIVRYDAWFLVLLAVLLVIAFSIFAALAVWCVMYKGKRFSGRWEWGSWYTSVYTECR